MSTAMRVRRLGVATACAGALMAAAACGEGGQPAPPAAGGGPAPGASAGPTVQTRSVPNLGTVLAGPDGRTLYLFEKDQGPQSSCVGACAQAWPPLTTSGSPTAGPGVDQGQLSTVTRSDGAAQVLYHGHPLYYYQGDQQPGQTSGQGNTGFGAGWYVLSPAGDKIEHGGGEGSGGGGGY